jgi:geranylgeranyl diphosphate synthase type I
VVVYLFRAGIRVCDRSGVAYVQFQQLLEQKRDVVNQRIDEILSSGFEQNEASELVRYTFKTGGKRLRPTMVLLATEAVGGREKPAVNAAVAVEFVHAASLIFDDLIDRDRVRRSAPTLNVAFNNDRAISAALFLASKGIQVLSEYKDPRVMKMIGWALVDLSQGEILDVISEIAIDVKHYLNIADLKTGALFAASAGIGGLIGGGSPDEVNALYNYGRAVGVAFQIRDDIMDLTGNGNSSKQERANLVLAHYLGDTARQENRVAEMLNPTENKGDPTEALRQKAVDFARRASTEHIQKAKSEIAILEDGDGKAALEELATFALERQT